MHLQADLLLKGDFWRRAEPAAVTTRDTQFIPTEQRSNVNVSEVPPRQKFRASPEKTILRIGGGERDQAAFTNVEEARD